MGRLFRAMSLSFMSIAGCNAEAWSCGDIMSLYQGGTPCCGAGPPSEQQKQRTDRAVLMVKDVTRASMRQILAMPSFATTAAWDKDNSTVVVTLFEWERLNEYLPHLTSIDGIDFSDTAYETRKKLEVHLYATNANLMLPVNVDVFPYRSTSCASLARFFDDSDNQNVNKCCDADTSRLWRRAVVTFRTQQRTQWETESPALSEVASVQDVSWDATGTVVTITLDLQDDGSGVDAVITPTMSGASQLRPSYFSPMPTISLFHPNLGCTSVLLDSFTSFVFETNTKIFC